jgi:hypothetical protein
VTKKVIGWVEWVALPDLHIGRIKAKTDTGARTSALHAEHIRIRHMKDGHANVTFTMFPNQADSKGVRVTCPLKESRLVKSSTGHETLRPVISTKLKIGNVVKRIELTLINRAPMEFRMLLGRTALKNLYVDPRASYLLSSHKGKT